MNCKSKTYCEISFHHNELASIGFDKCELDQLHAVTKGIHIKLLVTWGGDNVPHLIFQNGYNALIDKSRAYDFYQSFASWCFHKTGIQGYRLIHKRSHIYLLFDPHYQFVDPFIMLPNYDFSGFNASAPMPENFKIKSSDPFHLKVKSNLRENNPALTRATSKSSKSNHIIFAFDK